MNEEYKPCKRCDGLGFYKVNYETNMWEPCCYGTYLEGITKSLASKGNDATFELKLEYLHHLATGEINQNNIIDILSKNSNTFMLFDLIMKRNYGLTHCSECNGSGKVDWVTNIMNGG